VERINYLRGQILNNFRMAREYRIARGGGSLGMGTGMAISYLGLYLTICKQCFNST